MPLSLLFAQDLTERSNRFANVKTVLFHRSTVVPSTLDLLLNRCVFCYTFVLVPLRVKAHTGELWFTLTGNPVWL